MLNFMQYFNHLPSKKRFRSKLEVIQFVLHGTIRVKKTGKAANVAKDDHALSLTIKEEVFFYAPF